MFISHDATQLNSWIKSCDVKPLYTPRNTIKIPHQLPQGASKLQMCGSCSRQVFRGTNQIRLTAVSRLFQSVANLFNQFISRPEDLADLSLLHYLTTPTEVIITTSDSPTFWATRTPHISRCPAVKSRTPNLYLLIIKVSSASHDYIVRKSGDTACRRLTDGHVIHLSTIEKESSW